MCHSAVHIVNGENTAQIFQRRCGLTYNVILASLNQTARQKIVDRAVSLSTYRYERFIYD